MYIRLSTLTLAATLGLSACHRKAAPVPPNGVAEIVQLQGEVRTRTSSSLTWVKPEKHQWLLPDDALYTFGDGKARIILKHGSSLELSENSLLEVSGREVPRLESGNVRLSLQGDLKFNLAGYPLSLHGQDSQIQLYIEEPNLARLRLLAGSARVENASRPFDLLKNVVASPERPNVTADKDAILATAAGVQTQQTGVEYPFIDKLNDLYQRTVSGGWVKREKPSTMLDKSVVLRWKLSGLPLDLHVQLSPTYDFKEAQSFVAQGDEFQLRKVFRGDNYWRVSTNGRDWSAASFRTTPLPSPGDPPWLKMNGRTFKAKRPAGFTIESKRSYPAYMIEVAPLPDFNPKQTDCTWLTDTHYLFARPKAGDYFLRVRGINSGEEVSDYSPWEKITVEN